MRDLKELRTEIDQVDRTLVPLFCKRMGLAAEVAEYKRTKEMPVLDSSREQALLNKIKDLAGEEYAGYILKIYERILEESRNYQSEVLESK